MRVCRLFPKRCVSLPPRPVHIIGEPFTGTIIRQKLIAATALEIATSQAPHKDTGCPLQFLIMDKLLNAYPDLIKTCPHDTLAVKGPVPTTSAHKIHFMKFPNARFFSIQFEL